MVDETAAAPAAPAAPAVKPGWQTTEFWLHLIATLAGVVMGSGLPSNSKVVQVAGMALSLLSVLGYTTSRTMVKNAAAILLPLFLIFSISGCKTINKDALAAWTSGDVSMMQDLQDYRMAQGKPVDDVKAHLARAFGDVTADEENLLMTELLADIASDPKKSSNRKASYPLRVQDHLKLFNSLKGN